MPNPAPFSSPPLRLYARAAGVQIGAAWRRLAQLGGTGTVEHGASILRPFRAVGSIAKHRDELTKSSERVLKHSAVSLLHGWATALASQCEKTCGLTGVWCCCVCGAIKPYGTQSRFIY